MKLLLDTHAFIWWDSEPTKLSPQVLTFCQDPQNLWILSVASVWEMQVKLQLGKLKLSVPLESLIEGQHRTNNLEILPVMLAHVLALQNLLAHHKDPFDRMLICQAIAHGMIILTPDPLITQYPVRTVW